METITKDNISNYQLILDEFLQHSVKKTFAFIYNLISDFNKDNPCDTRVNATNLYNITLHLLVTTLITVADDRKSLMEIMKEVTMRINNDIIEYTKYMDKDLNKLN